MAAKTPQQWGEQWIELYEAGDADGILGLYHPEGTIVHEPGKSLTGHAAIKELINGFIQMKGDLKFNEKGVAHGEGAAICYVGWTFDAAGPDGPINMAGDATVALSRQPDGAWVALVDDFHSQG